MYGKHVWSLILAAGEGSRLRSLTTTAAGISVPKQFCTLRGGPSLLQQTVTRAAAVSCVNRIVHVVAAQHRFWWEASLEATRSQNIIVQPLNKGTATGLLLPLLHIARRDPEATVVVLPSDHFVRHEGLLTSALRQAVRLAGIDRRSIHLLGMTPEEPDPELGYIVPKASSVALAAEGEYFVEKPDLITAQRLIRAGALWNAFILTASARAFINLYEVRYPALVRKLIDVVSRDAYAPVEATAAYLEYPRLPTLDFSRDVLQGHESRLRVVTVPPCGWSDLGTPKRVIETLGRVGPSSAVPVRHQPATFLSLADQHLLQSATN